MKVSLVAFDDFTDVDLFFMWDALNRVRRQDWAVRILGEKRSLVSTAGLEVATHGPLSEANDSDIVLFASGKGTRRKIHDREFLDSFELNPGRQLIGSQCSGALILTRLGLLQGIPATTHRAVQEELRGLGVTVVNAPFVAVGNVATAGGCLSSQYLVGWVLERTLGTEARKSVLASLAPVGQEAEYEERVTAALSRESMDRSGERPTSAIPCDLHHAHLFASDLVNSIRFYREMFSAEVLLDNEIAGARNVLLRLGRGHINFYDQPPKDTGRGVVHHLGIRTDDLAALVGQMEAKGFRFRKPVTDLGVLKYVMAEGPDHVLLELFETNAV